MLKPYLMRGSNRKILVRKYSGNEQEFDVSRLRKALRLAKADQQEIDRIVRLVESQLRPGMSTEDIHSIAFGLLKDDKPSVAARYNLKRGIMELGPTGFPFESFVAELLKAQGYRIQVGLIVSGKCVKHEIDIIAEKDDEQRFIECKYHSQQGGVCDVKVPLYVNSRFLDVLASYVTMPEQAGKQSQGWVVTNTRLTVDAIQFGTCAGLGLWSWDYPAGKGLKDVIDKVGLYPVTCLTTLSTREKEQLLSRRIVLAKQIYTHSEILTQIGIGPERSEKVLTEARELCQALAKGKQKPEASE